MPFHLQIFSLLIFAFLFLVSLNKTSRQNSLFAVLQSDSEIFSLQMVRKYGISFSSTTKFRLKLMFCVIFVNVLVWRRFGVPLFPICVPLFPIRVPLVPICVTLSTYPISRYFCKDSLMTPPPTHHPTSSLFTVTVTPPKIFIVPFPSFSIRVPFVFTRVHSCSFVFIRIPFVFTRVHSCSIRVPLVFTRVHSCSTRVHSCSFVFVRVYSCSDLCGVLDMIHIYS